MTITSKIQTGWARVKFLYDYHSAMVLTATYETTGYEVGNLLNRLEGNYWLSTSTNTQYLTNTGSAGNNQDVDYLILYDHNLYTAGATVTLQYSNDNFSADEHDAFTGETPGSDDFYFKEFSQVSEDYWRLKITGASVAPQITIGYWGEITELEWVNVGFDPNELVDRSVVNRTDTGYVTGVYDTFIERFQSFTWKDVESDIYDKLETWRQTVGRQNFFTAWDTTDHSDEIYLMYWDGKWNNPLSANGRYRTITLNFSGRKL